MNAGPLAITPLSPVLGASVAGVRLDDPLDDDAFDAIERAFYDHGMLVFPGQHLGPAGQDAFGRRWGAPYVVPYLAAHAVDGFPAILRVTNMGKAGTLTENWHYDSAYFDEPPPIAILAAQQLPALGGDTMWASQYAAFDSLSPAMQALVGPLRAAFTGSRVVDGVRRDVVAFHSVVRTHPITGRRALGVGRVESMPHFEGMTEAESRPLAEFLYHHASRPEFVYRHRWTAGDVVMWDNRCLLHYAVHDYGDSTTRLLHRMTVLGPQAT
jgi:alpha-ketoglutarate-dependent taurine dioxygenase